MSLGSPTASAAGQASAAPAGQASDASLACQVTGVTAAYRAEPVLTDAHLAVPRGCTMGIVGPNGAGKSTLLKVMMGLMRPLHGEVRFFGEPLSAVRSYVAYVPQTASVDWDFPTTVLGVVLMGTYGRLGWLRRPGRREREQAREALAQVGMAELENRQIGQLSGGQRQRVLLARALVQNPDLFLLDEPYAGVDVATQHAIQGLLAALKAQGRSVVVVHHDLVAVRQSCDHVALLNKEIVATGPMREILTADSIARAYGITREAALLLGAQP